MNLEPVVWESFIAGDGKPGMRIRPIAPGEALQYALTCSNPECHDGWVHVEDVEMFQGGYMPVSGAERCDRCVDGIPRWAIETVAEVLFHQRFPRAVWGEGTSKRDIYVKDATAALVALRDREETE